MEHLYNPFRGRTVDAAAIDMIIKDKKMVTTAIENAFADKFFKTKKHVTLVGRNYLIGEMIRKYVVKILETDKKTLTPFIYIDSEKRVKDTIELSDGSKANLKGFIDRIDQVDGQVRIVDYKSGEGETVFNNVEELFDETAEKRNEKVTQVFLYSWIYARETGNKQITPCIYFARSLFGKFDPYVYQRT
jgi:ATP-dependent exoDNAse (exonuclease V) beta subunit